MTCYFPMDAYRSKHTGEIRVVGKKGGTFLPSSWDALLVPCRKCIGCRLDKAREWACRLAHESQLHDNNVFITLTYSPEWLPDHGHLSIRDLQKFHKRLRKKLVPKCPYEKGHAKRASWLKRNAFRYYSVGEYGDQFDRPHYHCCVFNCEFDDALFLKNTSNGHALYESETLNELWPQGHANFGELTYESACYAARYCLKKITGKQADDHYSHLDSDGRWRCRPTEFALMSRASGIGKDWYTRFNSDVFPFDECIIGERALPVPEYYRRQLKEHDPELYASVTNRRLNSAVKSRMHRDNYADRLAAREKVTQRRLADKASRKMETSDETANVHTV